MRIPRRNVQDGLWMTDANHARVLAGCSMMESVEDRKG
jgi:hypothetical protein